MGISPSDYQSVLHASNVIVNTTNAAIGAGDLEYTPDGPDVLTSLLESAQMLTSLMTELAEYRRGTPADDVTSALVNANIDGESLTPRRLRRFSSCWWSRVTTRLETP